MAERDRLAPLDTSFLRVETPAAHMHVGWKGVFAARAVRGPVSLGELRRLVAGRLERAPRFRRRLAFPAGGFGDPAWVDDERFDLRAHVTGLAPPPQTMTRRDFDQAADRVLSEPLDRTRPLWRLYVGPLPDGQTGLVMKVHHALVDGKSAVELALLLLDVEPDRGVDEPAEWEAEPAPSGRRLAIETLAERGEESLRLARGVAGLALRPARGVRLADTLRRAALSVGEDVLRPAPSSSLNVEIGPRRMLVGHVAPIGDLLAIKDARGATLNDAALAVVAGALRQLALERGELPRPLKVMIPVSHRTPDEAAELGNRIAFVFVELPVAMRSATGRLDAIVAATRRFKREQRAGGGASLLEMVGRLPGPVQDRAARFAASPRMYNLTVSNVPGPRAPVYLLGAELCEAFPVVPIAEGHALAIGLFSYRDKLCVGGYADPEALPDVKRLPDALTASRLELLHCVRRQPATVKRNRTTGASLADASVAYSSAS